jgi:hypothetical protein
MTTPVSIGKLRELAGKATEGPYFADLDDAIDAPDHKKSGLALVDTGRVSDWPIARLIEWDQARYTAALDPSTVTKLLDVVEAARQYRRECDNPSPDLMLRNRRRVELFLSLMPFTE